MTFNFTYVLDILTTDSKITNSAMVTVKSLQILCLICPQL